MSPADTARVLTKCAMYDRRTIGAADVAAWHEAIGDLDLQSALWAVAEWYAEHRDWVMPSDVRHLARPRQPPYWRKLPALPPAPHPAAAIRGVAACRAALADARTKRST